LLAGALLAAAPGVVATMPALARTVVTVTVTPS
jgi:hypothetical protein